MKKIICIIMSVTILFTLLCVQANAKTLYKGDIDNDGTVEVEEARWILQEAISSEQEFSDYNYERADIDGDGEVTVSDARLALRIAIGLDEDVFFKNDIYTEMKYTASYFKKMGVINDDENQHTWTYYSQKVLPGTGLNIPGRYVDENGYVCDGDGYICLAYYASAKGQILNTPFGKQGKVYDCCEASSWSISGRRYATVDVYVNW